MNLLIITQKVDKEDDNLGFFHDWINEFSKHCEKVIVICLYKGVCNFSDNVKVLTLGKTKEEYRQKKKYRLKYRLKYIFNFYKYIWQERKNYDKVFVHMNPEYVVLGGLLWHIFGKKIGLWYAHGHVPRTLKIAEKLVNIIFTSTNKGCRLVSKKIKIIGQGIDLNKFKVGSRKLRADDVMRLVTVGRISPSKDLETLIKAVEILNNKGVKTITKIVGGVALEEHKKYLEKLKKSVQDKGLKTMIEFVGSVSPSKIIDYYHDADIFVHTGQTGSLDKVSLEAMSSGLIIVSSNDAVVNEVFNKYKDSLAFKAKDSEGLAKRILSVIGLKENKKKEITDFFENYVKFNHGLNKLVSLINNYLDE